jgi:hypothetical protein
MALRMVFFSGPLFLAFLGQRAQDPEKTPGHKNRTEGQNNGARAKSRGKEETGKNEEERRGSEGKGNRRD